MDYSIKGESQYQYCIIVPNLQPTAGLTFTYEEPFLKDIGIIDITGPNKVLTLEGENNIEVNLFNYGTETLTSATIKWQVNDGTINTYNWAGSLNQATVAENVVIGSYNFTDEILFSLKIWTELPNGATDQNPNNDIINQYIALNLYCTSNIVYDEYYCFHDVVIGNIIHLNCGKVEDYSITDYSPYFQTNYAPGSNLNYDCFAGVNGYVAFWLDLNNDNDFDDTDEYLGTSEHFEYNENLTGSITIPATAPEGMHKLRIRFIKGAIVPGATDACTPLPSFEYEGDCHQYAINVYNPNTSPPCAFNPIPVNNSVDVVLNEILEWSSTDATNFDVYFGTTATPIFIQNQAENSYNPGLFDANTQYYWKITAKNDFGNATGCEIWNFTTGEDLEYCIPGNSDCDEWDDHIDDFYMVDLIHENTGCAGMSGYGDYTDTEFTTDLLQGANVTWSANYSTADALAIWIDLNDDGVFNETNEFVYHTEVEFVNEHIETGNFNLPQDAPLGIHRMRVRCGYYGHLLPDYEFAGNQACEGIGYSETHDYNITIVLATEPPVCATTPFPENESTNQYLNADLTWSASQASSYDVYFGTTTLEFVGEVTEAFYETGTLDQDTEYQWKIIPKNSFGEPSDCDIWTFTTGEDLEYCTEYLYYGDAASDPCDWGEYIDDFTIGDLEHLETGCTGGGYNVADFTFMTANLSQGSNYTWIANIHTTAYLAIWFDTNNDGEFDETECLYTSDEELMPDCSGTITIPASASLGEHRLRIRLKGTGATPILPSEACTAFAYGEAHDYTVIVTEPTQAPECAINPLPENEETGIILNYGEITWQADYASEFDVYFGTETNPPLVSENQISTNYNPGILDANTTYYWKIIPSNSIGGPDDCDVWSFTTTEFLEYCTNLYNTGMDYNCSWGDEIDDFSIADFEHLQTGCSGDGYNDYDFMTIELEKGNTYTFTVTNNNDDYNHFAIWIDYNNDGEFNNSNEFIYTTENRMPLSFTDELEISATAPNGEHRIRLRLKSSDPAMTGDDACTFYNFGETHDYTVNITGEVNIENISENINIYPNPASNFVTIQSDNHINKVVFFNYTGQYILQENINSNKAEIDLSNMQSGIYFLKIDTKNGISVKKLIIQ